MGPQVTEGVPTHVLLSDIKPLGNYSRNITSPAPPATWLSPAVSPESPGLTGPPAFPPLLGRPLTALGWGCPSAWPLLPEGGWKGIPQPHLGNPGRPVLAPAVTHIGPGSSRHSSPKGCFLLRKSGEGMTEPHIVDWTEGGGRRTASSQLGRAAQRVPGEGGERPGPSGHGVGDGVLGTRHARHE